MNYKNYTTNKLRNSFIIYSSDILIIDPQEPSISWFGEELIHFDPRQEVFVVLSHEHKNHFGGLLELLQITDRLGYEVSIITPAKMLDESILESLTNRTIIEIGVNDNFLIQDFGNSSDSIEVKRVFGHCFKMLNVWAYSQESNLLFLSDNLTTNFPPPITNEGGKLEKIINFYGNIIKEITNKNKIVLLPGHGVIKGKDHVIRLLEYYKSLPDIEWEEVAAILKDPKFDDIGGFFHSLNVSKA